MLSVDSAHHYPLLLFGLGAVYWHPRELLHASGKQDPQETEMRATRRIRLVICADAASLLPWSVIQMLMFPEDIFSGSQSGVRSYSLMLVMLSVGILA